MTQEDLFSESFWRTISKEIREANLDQLLIGKQRLLEQVVKISSDIDCNTQENKRIRGEIFNKIAVKNRIETAIVKSFQH